MESQCRRRGGCALSFVARELKYESSAPLIQKRMPASSDGDLYSISFRTDGRVFFVCICCQCVPKDIVTQALAAIGAEPGNKTIDDKNLENSLVGEAFRAYAKFIGFQVDYR